MTISGDYLFIGLIFLAAILTLFSFRIKFLPLGLAAGISWLTLGILLWTNQLGTSIGDPWTQALGFVFVLMVFVVLAQQMRTDIKHEKSVRGKIGGYPGAASESWTEWGPRKKHKETPKERQAAYRDRLKYKGPGGR